MVKENVISWIGSSVVFDSLERMGHIPQVLDLAIRPLDERSVVFGKIFTLQGIANVTHEQKVNSREFFERIETGDVLLVSTGGAKGIGNWGELMSTGAKVKGAAGVIVNGGCRDVRAVRDMSFPVFCEFASPFESGSEYCIGGWQDDIEMPGMRGRFVKCSPGDYVVADADGIIVIPAGIKDALLEVAFNIHMCEREAIVQMEQGGNINQAFLKNGVV